ncbi:glycosyltransferase family 2 protein [Azospirillum oleiclasticum]|uniref:glycosyltransferase family 2 protein n=1 Tax=Azospirillum oleiclasticum TaxID=2735135 RepID=UPI0031B65061
MAAIGVSVIIPAYRAHDTIARAVRSLLDQDWPDWEALVVSDDGTDYRPTLSAAGIDDPRVRFVPSGGVGTGAPAARNAGLRAARFDVVAPLDADDRFLPGRLSTMVPLAHRDGAAADNVAVVRDEDGAPLSTLFPVTGGQAVLDAARFLATSVPMFPVVRRELIDGWPEDVNFCDDVVFNVCAFDRVGSMPLITEPLYEYRQRQGSITFAADAGARAERCYAHVLERLTAGAYPIRDPELRSAFAAAIGRKRDLNAAYERAFRDGLCANFQEFLAVAGANSSPTPRVSDTSPSAPR